MGYGTTYWYHNDHLGTPQVMTNASQQVVWRAEYDAFGEANVLVSTIENPLRLPGQVADRHVAGLHYNWHRYYDATTGRYVSSDPIGLEGGENTFAYALASPLMYFDTDGLAALLNLFAGPNPHGDRAATMSPGLPGFRNLNVVYGHGSPGQMFAGANGGNLQGLSAAELAQRLRDSPPASD